MTKQVKWNSTVTSTLLKLDPCTRTRFLARRNGHGHHHPHRHHCGCAAHWRRRLLRPRPLVLIGERSHISAEVQPARHDIMEAKRRVAARFHVSLEPFRWSRKRFPWRMWKLKFGMLRSSWPHKQLNPENSRLPAFRHLRHDLYPWVLSFCYGFNEARASRFLDDRVM